MIPKTIHYCWFNDTPIPYSLQVCMDSWKKNLLTINGNYGV